MRSRGENNTPAEEIEISPVETKVEKPHVTRDNAASFAWFGLTDR